jgi:rSAM/selenodomain-associated transferase 2
LRLSIVVPTLDEARRLPACLASARAASDDVVVSDGGSRDGTVALARALGARVVEGPAGRGGQLGRGAAAASGDVLLFLHADTVLPPGAREAVAGSLAAGAEGGAFLLRFDDGRRIYRLGERFVAWRTRLSRLPLGDQAQFVRRDVYAAMGGYRDWPILEDLDFARRLRARGRLAVLPLAVTTAARRYSTAGVARTLLTNWAIWLLYALGVPPQRLARLYRQIR